MNIIQYAHKHLYTHVPFVGLTTYKRPLIITKVHTSYLIKLKIVKSCFLRLAIACCEKTKAMELVILETCCGI